MKKILLLFPIIIIGACINQNIDNQNKYIEKNNINNKEKDVTKYTLKEISKHNNNFNCWTIINNKVYDISSFFGKHPGGDKNLLKICGKDGTELFNNKHGNNNNAKNKLKTFYIGDIK